MFELAGHFFPPRPSFTEAKIGDLSGKVYLITGPTSGIGLHLASLLYSKNATVFLAGRGSATRLATTAQSIQSQHPSSRGTLHQLELDLSSLPSVKSAAQSFLQQSDRLDILFNNAGVLGPLEGNKLTADGTPTELAVHCYGPYLLVRLLEKVLRDTAAREPASAVRVVWPGSVGVVMAPRGGVDMEQVRSGRISQLDPTSRYNISKVGVYFLSESFRRGMEDAGIVHVTYDPGAIQTNLQRNFDTEISKFGHSILKLMLKPVRDGACTVLFAAFSPDVTAARMAKEPGTWVIPLGRTRKMRQDLLEASSGVTGEEFLSWCEERTREFY